MNHDTTTDATGAEPSSTAPGAEARTVAGAELEALRREQAAAMAMMSEISQWIHREDERR